MKRFTQMLFVLLLIGIVLPIQSLKADSPRMILFEFFSNSNTKLVAQYNTDWDKLMLSNESFLLPIRFSVPDENDSLYLANPTVNGDRTNYYGVDTIPNFCINGNKIAVVNWADTLANINKVKGLISPYTISITQSNQATKVTADVNIAASTALNGKVLRVALVEWSVNYEGESGASVHRWIVRDLFTNPSQLDIAAGANATFPVEFASISKYKKNNLYIVAFIQDESTKEVLQAGTNLNDRQLRAEVSIEIPTFQSVDRNTNLTKVFNVKNLSNVETQFQLTTDASFISNPEGCQISLNKSTVTLPVGGSEDITLTINTTNQAVFANLILLAMPMSNEKIIRYDYKSFDILTNDAKYAVYTGTHSSNDYAYQMFAAKSQYSRDLVAIPANISNIFRNFPPKQFKVAVMGYNLSNSSLITGSDGVSVIEAIKAMLNDNKRVMFTGEGLATIAFNTQIGSSVSFKDFIKRNLGISKVKTKQRYSTGTSSVTLLPFTVHGNSADVIGQTLGTMNANKSTSNFDLFSDALEITPSNTVSAVSYYDSKPEEIAGLRHEFEKGKIVYFSYGFNAFNNAADRSKLFDNTLTWLMNDVIDGAQVELSSDNVEFRDVLVNKTVTKKITIKNKGSKTLTIESINLESQTEAFSIQNKPSGKVNLPTGQSIEITVAFTPSAAEDYYDNIEIVSNSKFNNPTYISLFGEGVNEATLPIISVDTTPIDFDTTEVQTTKTQKIVIKNEGNAELTIDMLDFPENDEVSFDTPEANLTPIIIDIDDEFEVNITFLPTNEGTFNGKLRIQSNDQNNSEITINLTGKGYKKDPGSVNEPILSKNGNFTMRTMPNPMVNNGNVEFTVSNIPANVDMYVIDASGKTIENIYNGSSVLGNVNLPINTAKYSNGHYTIIANVNGEQISLPLIISK